ncbi:hypothetical protein V6N13_013410 [Hibiscus sabdariffa]
MEPFPLRPSKFSFEYLLLPPRSAPTAAPPGPHAPGFTATAAPSYSSGPGPFAPTAGHALTRTLLRRSRSVGGAPVRDPTNQLLAPYGFSNPLTRTHVRLLGPCSRRAGWGARRPTPGARWCRSTPRRRVLGSTIEVTTSPRAYQRPGLGPPPRSASVHAPSRSADRLSPFHIRPGRIAGPHPPPSRQFQALFDSLFKVLFIFPSRYLFAIGSRGTTGLSPSPAPLSRGLGPGPSLRTLLQTTIRTAEGDRFSSWAIPGSLAVTKGILAGFDNDPSAGSPTETLLRLLLPLNDKVQWTSRDVAGSEPPTSPRSEHFTGPFNRINQVAFLRDVRPAWSSTHYLGRGEAITRREHRSCRGTKCTSYERTGPRPYAHEIFRIRKHDRASMHRRSRIMSIDTLGTPGTTEVHQATTRSLDGQGMAIHPIFHRFRYATQDPYRTPWARRPQGEDIEE